MLKINFEPPEDASWKRWRKKCDRATAKVIEEYINTGKVTINGKLYKELKEFIYRKEDGQFHGKCAYCEQKISGNQHVDIDHFRPKKMVTDEKDNIVFINKAKKKKHPGYYWLALSSSSK